MEVLLSEDVPGLGDIGQKVTVKSGYARNFLIPRGFAVESGAKSAAALAHKMRQVEKKKRDLQVVAQELGTKISAKPLELGLRVGSGGKVFGSIRRKEIADKLSELGFDVDRRRVQLEEPIKRTGSLQVSIKLHPEVVVSLTVNVEALAATKEEEKAEADEVRTNMEEAVEAKTEQESLEVELSEANIEETIEAEPTE